MALVIEGQVRFPGDCTEVLERFCEEFVAVELPVLTTAGVELVGAWTLSAPDQVVLVHVYGAFGALKELTDGNKRIGQLATDHPFTRLYSWISTTDITYSRTVRMLGGAMDVGWCDALKRTRPVADAPYFLARCRYALTAEPTFRAALAGSLDVLAARDDVAILLAYDTLFGEHGDTAVIGTARSRTAFEAALNEATAEMGCSHTPWSTSSIVPTGYSPLG